MHQWPFTCGHGFLQVYDIPHLHVEGKLCRTNLPPRTIMRGPGFLNAVMVAEQVTTTRLHHPTFCPPGVQIHHAASMCNFLRGATASGLHTAFPQSSAISTDPVQT